jgi:hypothetical protein
VFTLLRELIHAIRELTKGINKMAVGQEQFDQDLQALTTAITNLIAAIEAFLALPPVVDLSNEDASVNAALTAVQTEISKIPPPPPPQP